MLGFIVPIKPKGISNDWHYDNLLLERTVKSICAQVDQDFQLFLVYNDEPEINYSHPNIHYLQFPYPSVAVDDIEDLDYVLKYYSRTYAEKMMDKGRKVFFGCKIAIESKCDYLMSVDSDDLVSKYLSAFVNGHSLKGGAGWRLTKGYIYEEDAFLLIKSNSIQNINGSTHVIRKDLVTIPDFQVHRFWNFNLFEAHGYTYNRLKDCHNEILEDYPYFGVVYTVHKNNYSNILKLTSAKTIKNMVKKILRGRLLTNRIREEFNLEKLIRKQKGVKRSIQQ